jgi:hypothetical protein
MAGLESCLVVPCLVVDNDGLMAGSVLLLADRMDDEVVAVMGANPLRVVEAGRAVTVADPSVMEGAITSAVISPRGR